MIIENCVVWDIEGQAKTFFPNSRVNNLMEDRREPHIFYDVCHLASLWKSLRLNRLFPMHETHRATHRRRQWFDNSLQRSQGVKCSTSLPTTVAHNYARSPSFLFFIYGRLFNFFFTSVQKSLPFYLFNG